MIKIERHPLCRGEGFCVCQMTLKSQFDPDVLEMPEPAQLRFVPLKLPAPRPSKPRPAELHECHAIGCRVPVRPELLMCPKHWRMVPYSIRVRVCLTYRPGQATEKNPSREWIDAARKAIAAVADLERRPGKPAAAPAEVPL